MTPKIDKKELQEPDKLQLIFLTLRSFAEQHRTPIYAGAALLILILLFTGGLYLYWVHYESSAGKEYTRIFETRMKQPSSAGEIEAIKGYKGLITQYPRSRAASTAHYRLGNIYLGRGEIDPAIDSYQEFIKKSSEENDLVTLAYNGLGESYEYKKDFKKALEFYEKTLKTTAAPSFEAMIYSSIARIHEAMSNPAKAGEYYQMALGKTSDPLMTLYFKRKISFLG